jgi:hypothetical protein
VLVNSEKEDQAVEITLYSAVCPHIEAFTSHGWRSLFPSSRGFPSPQCLVKSHNSHIPNESNCTRRLFHNGLSRRTKSYNYSSAYNYNNYNRAWCSNYSNYSSAWCSNYYCSNYSSACSNYYNYNSAWCSNYYKYSSASSNYYKYTSAYNDYNTCGKKWRRRRLSSLLSPPAATQASAVMFLQVQ